MARIKIDLPQEFVYSINIPIRITDINYGGHVGNDKILSLLHEARMHFLSSMNYTELDFGGTGLIMSDVAIEFKSELFYGNHLMVQVSAGGITRAGFDLFYKLTKEQGKLVAVAKTGMVCYDYSLKKVVSIPEKAMVNLRQKEYH